MSATFGTFFAVRGTHLAAMVAYFALASVVPLVFLALAMLGLFGRVDESSALVTYLSDLLPSRSVDEIVGTVQAVQDNARKLGIVGGIFLFWSSLSLFSSLESAFNVVYGRPNRPFLRGKALALAYMAASLVVLFAGLVVGTFGSDVRPPLRPRLRRQPAARGRAHDARLGARALPLPPLCVLPPDERAGDTARGAAGSHPRSDRAGGRVAGPADLRPACRATSSRCAPWAQRSCCSCGSTCSRM